MKSRDTKAGTQHKNEKRFMTSKIRKINTNVCEEKQEESEMAPEEVMTRRRHMEPAAAQLLCMRRARSSSLIFS